MSDERYVPKHTPAPWGVYEDLGGVDPPRPIVTAWDEEVVDVAYMAEGPRALADARLVAGAPEMLDACLDALAWQRVQGVDGGDVSDALAEKLEKAVAKATGERPDSGGRLDEARHAKCGRTLYVAILRVHDETDTVRVACDEQSAWKTIYDRLRGLDYIAPPETAWWSDRERRLLEKGRHAEIMGRVRDRWGGDGVNHGVSWDVLEAVLGGEGE